MPRNLEVEEANLNSWAVAPARYDFSNWRVATETSPRINELPENTPIVGFTPERAVFIKSLLESTGLPLERVTNVTYKPNDKGNEGTLGQARITTGELSFFKNMDKLPTYALQVSQLEVVIHELGHVNTPFYAENMRQYGSEKNRQDAANNAILVAIQTDKTHSFLSGYHKHLYKELLQGKINQQTFIEETNAIMLEQRFCNPNHLKQVLNAQSPDSAENVLAQLDKTLLCLMPQFRTVQELNNHISSLKRSLIKQGGRTTQNK